MALTDEQKKLRATAYGASEVATVLGIGPGKLIDLYEAKVSPRADDFAEDVEAIELGNLLEEPVARIYARRTKTFLHRVRTIVHPTRPLAIATPDRARFMTQEAWARADPGTLEDFVDIGAEQLAECDRLVEVKTTGSRYRRDYGADGSARVPEEKAVQVTWQMGVTNVRLVDLPVLFRGEWGVKVETFSVPFNVELFELTYEAVERFHHDHVLARKPPPPDGSDRYDEALKRMFPTNKTPPIVATQDDERLLLRYAQFREVASRAERLKKTYAQQLKLRIGDAGGLITDALGKLTWTQSKPKPKIDWQKAAQEFQLVGAMCLQLFDQLKQHGEQISDSNRAGLEARLKNIIPGATIQKPGHRSLRPYLKGAAAFELDRMRVTLDALEVDAEESDDEAPHED